MTYQEFLGRMEKAYGDPGVHAVETSCLTPEDLDKGYDHCLDRILPALEEEMSRIYPSL